MGTPEPCLKAFHANGGYHWYPLISLSAGEQAARALIERYTYEVPVQGGVSSEYVYTCVQWGTRYKLPNGRYELASRGRARFDLRGSVYPQGGTDTEGDDARPRLLRLTRVPDYYGHCNDRIEYETEPDTLQWVLETSLSISYAGQTLPGDSDITGTTRLPNGNALTVLANQTPQAAYTVTAKLWQRDGYDVPPDDWVLDSTYSLTVPERTCAETGDDDGGGDGGDSETDYEREVRLRNEYIRRYGDRDILLLTGGLALILISGALHAETLTGSLVEYVAGSALRNVTDTTARALAMQKARLIAEKTLENPVKGANAERAIAQAEYNLENAGRAIARAGEELRRYESAVQELDAATGAAERAALDAEYNAQRAYYTSQLHEQGTNLFMRGNNGGL